MKKLKRVFGSVANLTSGRGGDNQSADEPPPSIALNTSRKSISGSVQGLSTHRGSYVSYESQSLDSYNSTMSTDIDPFSKQDKNFTKLHKWAYLGDVVKLKKFIKKIPVDAQDSEGKTALHHAAAQGRGDALLFLLGSKGNVEVKDSNGMTPFLRAVERCQLHIVQMLLQRRVDAQVTDCQGNNSCHLAARAGAAELLSLLLDCGGDCDAQNSLGRTPIHLACGENQQDTVETLLRRGASVNVTDKEGVTPLMSAAKVGSAPLVETLLEHGADVSPIDASKWSAADYARFTNHNQLHHRLSSLMEKGGTGLFSDDLLNVSDEGTSQEEGAVGFSPKAKPSDNEGAVDSWSDNSDVNSVKEKPKLNLAKFLPSSDESADNVFSNPPDVSSIATGPPKPPRLYTSSSSLASVAAEEKDDDIHAEDSKIMADEDKESFKADDSWKSSSEDEPRLPPFSPTRKSSDTLREAVERKESLNNSVGSEARAKGRNTDLMTELGLGNIDYHSSEEVSFDEEDAILPIGEAQKEVMPSKQTPQITDAVDKVNEPSLPAESVGQGDLRLHESPMHSSRSSTKTSKQSPKESKERLNADSPLSVSPPISRGGRNRTPMNLSPRKSPAKKSPKKLKSRERKSSNFDSDTDDEVSIPKRPARRKSATPTKKKKENLPLKGPASDESDWEKEEDELSPRSPPSKGFSGSPISKHNKRSSPEKYQDRKNDSANSKGGTGKVLQNKGSNSDINKLSVFAGNNDKSRSNTLSTVVGTLGREGTMQELEEMWEANPRISPKRSSSSSSVQNSEDLPKPLLDVSDVPDGSKVSLKPKEASVSGNTAEEQRIDKTKGRKEDLETEDAVKDSNDIDDGDDDIDPVLVHDSQSDLNNPSFSPKCITSKSEATKNFAEGKSHAHVDNVSLENKFHPNLLKENTEKNREYKSDKGSKDHDRAMPKGHSSVSTSHSRRGSKTGTGRTSGFGSIVFSDDDSLTQDPLTTPRLIEDIDDGISAASTETEESTHINSGLKDSLLTPLSSLPDANNVNQLQDLIRELRLKLDKEFGRRAAMETRYSHLQQQEKLCRLQNEELEQDVQRLRQEITSLTARIKQLEYLGQCEQDSSRLKDQSLEEYQVHCTQLEDQYGSLRTHAMQQEQLVESLMFQLQTKERVNQSLQGKLEDISSQTKYVSMKSCQTEEVFVSTVQESSERVIGTDVSLQTCNDSPEMVTTGLQTDDILKDPEPLTGVDCPNCHNLKQEIPCETNVVSVQTEIEKEHKINEATLMDASTQSEKLDSHETQSIGIQFSPEKEMKGCQTQKNIQSHHAQTEMSGSNCDVVCKKTVSDSACQISFAGRVAVTQTDNCASVTDMQPLENRETVNLSTAEITSALEPALHNLTQDVKTLIMEAADANHSSLQELLNQFITTQLENLKGSMESSLQEKSAQQSQETELKFSEWIHRLEDILRGQADIVTKMCNNSTKTDESGDVHNILSQVNNGLESKFQKFKSEIEELQKEHGHNEEKLASHMETIMKDVKESNCKIMKCLGDLQTEHKDSNLETYDKINQLTLPQFKELHTAIQTINHSKDDGLFEAQTKDIFNRLDYLEKSVMSALQKSFVSQDVSFIEDELHKFNDSILKKLTVLQNNLHTVDSDGRIDQDTLESYMNTLKDSNKQLIHILKTKTSESTTNINEAMEENFHILQDHLRKIQQSLMQRINEVSQQANIAEDQKVSWMSKQMTEMASQVSGMQTSLMRMQSSFEAAQNLPSTGGVIDETLISSLRASNEQAVSTLKFQNQSVIQLLESLQKEVHSSIQKSAPTLKDSTEIHMLKETLNEKEEELRRVRSSQESLQEKLRSQCLSLDRSQHKEEELRLKIESLSEKLHHLQEDLKERDEKISLEKARSASQSEESSKIRQENLRLTTENSKLSSLLSAEQQQKQWYEGELQSQKDARETAETKVQEMLMQLQMAQQQIPLQRTPPTGRDNDDDSLILKQQEIKKLQANLKESETQYNEQLSRSQRLELQLREVEADLGLEKASKEDLVRDLKKYKDTVSKLQKDLSDAIQEHDTLQELQSSKEELEAELKSNEMAMDTYRKKLESVNKEKLQLKQDIMLLKGEKLSFDLIKQEKDLAEEMQRKTETQLQLLQRRISTDYVPKSKMNQLYREMENKYQLELSAKISELSSLMEEQSQHQVSQAKAKESREQGLKNELSKLSEEVIRLRAMLSVREEEDDTWKTRHNRLMNLYQQQTQTYNSIHKSPNPKKSADESLSASLREIEAHLQAPYATSTLLGQLTPPPSLQPLPKMPSNIDSYHYTHCDSLDRTLQKYLKAADNDHSRYLSSSDDKPHARISPMQPSQLLHDPLPTLDKSCDDYVDLLKKKYGL